MMTRKDYIAVSHILSDYAEVMPPEEYLDICRDFAKYMAQDNDRFDGVRFLEACGLTVPQSTLLWHNTADEVVTVSIFPPIT
jgi:hypothetical protein